MVDVVGTKFNLGTARERKSDTVGPLQRKYQGEVVVGLDYSF